MKCWANGLSHKLGIGIAIALCNEFRHKNVFQSFGQTFVS